MLSFPGFRGDPATGKFKERLKLMSDRIDPRANVSVGLFQDFSFLSGGQAYEVQLEAALRRRFNVEVRNVYPKRVPRLPGIRLRQVLAATRGGGWSVSIRGFVPAIPLALHGFPGRQIILIHHLDHTEVPHSRMSTLLERLFARALRRADRLVVVSPFWEKWFQDRFNDLAVSVVHNGFDVDAYTFPADEMAAFRKRFGFDDRPIVYLGNCQRAKGVVEAYEALSDGPYELVTSGRRGVTLPCRHLDVSFEDYRRLLSASDVVLAVSRFLEGWNRTAHEALLAGTPVVGFPTGGLGDLLSGAGQIKVASVADLPDAVSQALDQSNELVSRGSSFAREFTLERFSRSWEHLVVQESQMN